MKLLIRWQPNPASENVTKYKLYQRHAGGAVSLAQSTDSTQALLLSVPSGIKGYMVSAVNANGEGPRCAMVHI